MTADGRPVSWNRPGPAPAPADLYSPERDNRVYSAPEDPYGGQPEIGAVSGPLDPLVAGPQDRPGYPPGELESHGVRLVHNDKSLTVQWENGCGLDVALRDVRLEARVEAASDGADVLFHLRVLMPGPDGMQERLTARLPVPAWQAAHAERLAAALSTRGGDPPPPAWPPQPPPAQERPPTPEPPQQARQATSPAPRPPEPVPAPPSRPPLPEVQIQAAPTRWASDKTWIGLWPTRETEQLLTPAVQQPGNPQAG
jgi:hypothetical protein